MFRREDPSAGAAFFRAAKKTNPYEVADDVGLVIIGPATGRDLVGLPVASARCDPAAVTLLAGLGLNEPLPTFRPRGQLGRVRQQTIGRGPG